MKTKTPRPTKTVPYNIDTLKRIAGEHRQYDVPVLVNMIFKVDMGESTALPEFSECETREYNDLTNWLWFQTHPWWERDGLSHTSDVCRSLAVKVIDFLKTLPRPIP